MKEKENERKREKKKERKRVLQPINSTGRDRKT